ncbi:MAG: hypothetical protein JO235_29080, partial [Chroococcidiopsidaceae cyanobacterium CP_BM_RX_35]|nr:hypothetical protein [Chroococcidiopsidaceae cyanobacterium CP_BM_RX_35]
MDSPIISVELFWPNHLKKLLTLGITSFFSIAVVAPASALQVKVAPAKPQLGDTLSVTIEQDARDSNKSVTSSPVVTFNQKSYPTFLLAPNQFRVLLPTTPLDRAGIQLLQVRDTRAGEEQKVSVELR